MYTLNWNDALSLALHRNQTFNFLKNLLHLIWFDAIEWYDSN